MGIRQRNGTHRTSSYHHQNFSSLFQNPFSSSKNDHDGAETRPENANHTNTKPHQPLFSILAAPFFRKSWISRFHPNKKKNNNKYKDDSHNVAAVPTQTTTRSPPLQPHRLLFPRLRVVLAFYSLLFLLLIVYITVNVAVLGRPSSSPTQTTNTDVSLASSWTTFRRTTSINPPAAATTRTTTNVRLRTTTTNDGAVVAPRVIHLLPVQEGRPWYYYYMSIFYSSSFMRQPHKKKRSIFVAAPLPPLPPPPIETSDGKVLYHADNNQSHHFTQPPERELSLEEKECRPLAAWQTASYPTCNNLHDIDMRTHVATPLGMDTDATITRKPSSSFNSKLDHTNGTATTTTQEEQDDDEASSWWPELSILARGWFRTTWEYHPSSSLSSTSTTTTVVLKTLRLEREFLAEYYDLHNRDAVAMERLTFSPYVVNVYGYCGQSAVNEYADFPYGDNIKSLEKLNRLLRDRHDARTMLLRLVIAAGLATGLADVHRAGREWHVDHPPRNRMAATEEQFPALMVHYDMNPRNIALFRGGRPKINDFNIAEFIHYNPRTGQPCGFPSRMHSPWWRSPEEVQLLEDDSNNNNNNSSSSSSNNHTIIWLNEKVDIYALGSTLFHLFTSYSPRGKMTLHREDMVRRDVLAGKAPALFPPFDNATDVVSRAFQHVLPHCHHSDPHKRWSAAQISNYFLQILRRHKRELMQAVQQEEANERRQQQQEQRHDSLSTRQNGSAPKMTTTNNSDSTSSLVLNARVNSNELQQEEEEEAAVLEQKG